MMDMAGNGDTVVLSIRGIMVFNGSWMEMPDMNYATVTVSCSNARITLLRSTTANTDLYPLWSGRNVLAYLPVNAGGGRRHNSPPLFGGSE